MGFSMTYVAADQPARPFSLEELSIGLKSKDPDFDVDIDEQYDDGQEGFLAYGLRTCGHLELWWPGEGFRQQLQVLRELIVHRRTQNAKRVKEILSSATVLLDVRVLTPADGTLTDSLHRMEPMWEWLFDHHDGILCEDLTAFVHRDDLLIEVVR